MKYLMIFSLGISALLMGCSSTLKDYEGTSPAFKLEDFFTGNLFAYGIVQDRSGKVTRRFTADLVGTWDGNEGVLEEDFYYADGEQDRRVWYITKVGENQYTGRAEDAVVDAIGQTSGYAFNWKYVLAIEVNERTWNIKLNDWLYLVDENRLINRADMTKWGFKVGEVTLVIEKEE